jgi:hypothetical protein
MLRTPTSNRIPSVVEKNPDMEALHTALKAKEAQPNVMTLEVFRSFEQLFKRRTKEEAKRDEELIKRLTEQFVKIVDFYKETHVIASATDLRVLLVMPAIFTPVRSLAITERNASLVATNQAMFHNNVPKYSGDAFKQMVDALCDEQRNNAPVLREYRTQFITAAEALREKYSGARAAEAGVAPVVDQPVSLNEGTEWDDE